MALDNKFGIVVRLYSPFAQNMFRDVPIDYFCEVDVNCNDLRGSNHFLLSLWNEMNLMLHPKESKYVPWYYRPIIVSQKKNWKLLLLGDVHTVSGNFHLMLKMKNKSSIKSLLAYNYNISKNDCQHLFEELVARAKQNVSKLKTFSSTIRLKCHNSNVRSIGVYCGSNYFLRSNRKGFCIDIQLKAIDYIEAQQQMVNRLDDLCAFLAVETNLFFTFETPLKITENDKKLSVAINQSYIKPYIDGPSVRNNVLLLSEAGIGYLDKFVFVDRDPVEVDEVVYFKRSCVHVYEGLDMFLKKGDKVAFSTKNHNFILSPKDAPRIQNIITMAATSFLSAIETVSSPEGKKEVCSKCGNVMYKISARIENTVSKYLNQEMGRTFKELYNLRSKYLHAGKISCESVQITARPFIDPTTGSGLTDKGFISCKVKGQMMLVDIQNIQELTTYILRCYYQEHLCGINSFEPRDEHGNDVDLKQIIMTELQKRMPKGVEILDVSTL